MTCFKQLNLILLFVVLFYTSIFSQGQEQRKTGILLVTFGTSYSDAQKAFDNIEEEVKKAFPNTEVRWAYSSNFIRNKLKKQGQHFDSPAEALAKYAADGYTHIAVQSLHVIPGEEYENLAKTVSAFNHMPQNAEVTLLVEPLLYHHQDMEMADQAIKSIVPDNLDKNDAVLFMGHGTHHQSNIYYAGLQYYLSQSSDNLFIATVEGFPELREVLSKLKAQKIEKVYLMPFMSVAGDHAQNDMAGDDPESWKSQLEAKGYKVEVIMKGLAEYDEIVQIWIKHLQKTLEKFE